jgi:hypothetical protein
VEEIVKFISTAAVFLLKGVIGLLFYIVFIIIMVKMFNLTIDGLTWFNRRNQRKLPSPSIQPLQLTVQGN